MHVVWPVVKFPFGAFCYTHVVLADLVNFSFSVDENLRRCGEILSRC